MVNAFYHLSIPGGEGSTINMERIDSQHFALIVKPQRGADQQSTWTGLTIDMERVNGQHFVSIVNTG